MFSEDDLLPLSALQHLVFCSRRAALVHMEGIWDENRFTMQGRILHERTHILGTESRGDLRIVRGLSIRSLRLGLSGKTDVVEFHRLPESSSEDEAQAGLPSVTNLPGIEGLWRPFPVEYKRGRRRHERGYEVQLCAQAICLEEMLHGSVPCGAIFYAKTGRRLEIAFDKKLRTETREAAILLHRIVGSGKTPQVRYEKKCNRCSLISICMPKITGSRRSVRSYVEEALADTDGETT